LPCSHRFASPARPGAALVVLILAAGIGGTSAAQELVPRAYWPAPTGTNVLAMAYQHSAGDIVVDPSLPITGVDSRNDVLQPTFQRTFRLSGRTASVQLGLPFADGKTEGVVDGEFRKRLVSGMGDLRARIAVNLKGAPSMNLEEFLVLVRDPETIVGTSLTLQIPTGVYDRDRLINIGTNRWAAKPAVGAILPLARSWLFEAEAGVWIFGNNDDFLGTTRKQDPILSTEVHLIKIVSPSIWVSVDANYYAGGKTRVGGERNADLQRNSRAGLSAMFPVRGRHAFKASFSAGIVTESGGDFSVYSLSYLYAWR
jgi:hypothetical protein